MSDRDSSTAAAPGTRSRHCTVHLDGDVSWVRLPSRAATRAPAVLDAMEASTATAVIDNRVRVPAARARAFAERIDAIVAADPVLEEPIGDGAHAGLVITRDAWGYRVEPNDVDDRMMQALEAIGARAPRLRPGTWRVLARRAESLRALVSRLRTPARRTTRVLHVDGVELTKTADALLFGGARFSSGVLPIALHPAERSREPGRWRLPLADVALYNRWASSLVETPRRIAVGGATRDDGGYAPTDPLPLAIARALATRTVRRSGARRVLQLPRDAVIIDTLRALGGTYVGGRRWHVDVRVLGAHQPAVRTLLSRLDALDRRRRSRRARRARRASLNPRARVRGR